MNGITSHLFFFRIVSTINQQPTNMKFAIVLAICFISAVLAVPVEREFIPLLKHVENHDEHGQYNLEYLSGDGTNVKEAGHLVDGPEGHVIAKKGSFKFTSPEGQTFEVSYVADENGFRAVGDHLPKDMH